MSRYFLLRKISLCFSQQFKCVCNSRAKFAESFHQMSNLSKGNQTFSLNMLVYEIQSFETRAHSLNPAKSVVTAVVVSWRRTVWPAFLPKAYCTCALISFLLLSRSTSYVGFHGWNVTRKESIHYVWLQDVINNSDHQAVLRLSNLVEGIYKFKLTVADGKGLKGNDDVILTVKEGALPNQFVNAWWLTFYRATSVCIFSILF